MVTSSILAARTGTFPAAEWLKTGPGASRGTLRAIGIGDAGFNVFEEPSGFLFISVEMLVLKFYWPRESSLQFPHICIRIPRY